ncbi:hypothetical protein E2C01_001261 [Portunus trituberculatus]|uniref:Uncharacterized protein n=1 Tax=Portunus trituberculatus TaxID=210409 RepID=A0A5B7CHI7_PORTR|nr:hypothetical protein [Portunus trituberculatus]
MWAFHGNLWVKGSTFLGYLLPQGPPARKPLPRVRKPNLHLDRGQDRTRALGDPSEPKARMVPLHHGSSDIRTTGDGYGVCSSHKFGPETNLSGRVANVAGLFNCWIIL